MSQTTAVLLGAIAGATIFLGLPVARLRGVPKAVQGFLNAFATGILIFLLWDILSHAGDPVNHALAAARAGDRGPFDHGGHLRRGHRGRPARPRLLQPCAFRTPETRRPHPEPTIAVPRHRHRPWPS